MAIWYHLFLQFLFILFCLIISCVHGGRDIARYNVGETVSSSAIAKGRSLNSMQEGKYTKDAYGQGIILALSELDGGGGGNFAVTVGFGTPKRDFTLLFDTGSDVSWIQCQPCGSGCNNQQPIFDPSKSQTFSNATCTNSGKCGFTVDYNDGSYSTGYYANDTLSFMSTDVLEGFVFGCTQNIGGDFTGTSGVLGTGRGDFSLMAQTDPNFLGLFCYCLPASQDSKGYLAFGVQAYEVCPVVEPKKMLSLTVNPNQNGVTQYFVKLTGITIGQKRLNIGSIVGSPLNAIIDSGTVITRLPPLVYGDLRSEFQNIMSPYPVAPGDQFLDTCYNLQGVKNWTTPEMVMHFEDSLDVKLDPSAVTLKISDSQVCLAFAGNKDASDLTIIGNHQHRELNVLYDTNNKQLAISPASTGCTI